MEWQEINFIVDALKLLVGDYENILRDPSVGEDARSDATNDLAYAEILLHKYENIRSEIATN